MGKRTAYFTARNRRRRDKRKLQGIQYLGSVCYCCGSTAELEFHHIAGEKDSAFGNKMRDYGEARFLAELKKCILLCQDCHRALGQHTSYYGLEPASDGCEVSEEDWDELRRVR